MDGKQVSVEELRQTMAADFDQLAQEVAAASNAAKEGRIIADTEEVVRDAHAQFRERMYAQAIRLLQSKQEALSPSARRASEQGQAADHLSDDQPASGRL